jgi:TRAP-type mannitol/chloroaromatic compound transport system permease large subunit
MLPGFFLTFLYLVYIIGWAILNPKVAPKLPPDKYRIPVPGWIERLQRGSSQRVVGGLLAAVLLPSVRRALQTPDGHPVGYGLVLRNLLTVTVPLALTVGLFATGWWYVVIYNAPSATAMVAPVAPVGALGAQPVKPPELGVAAPAKPEELGAAEPDKPQELGAAESSSAPAEAPAAVDAPPQEVGTLAADPTASTAGRIPEHFALWFWACAVLAAIVLGIYYWRMDGEQLQILKELVVSVVPLGVLTVVVLAVILLGITTATESAAVGALGAIYLAAFAKSPRRVLWSSLVGGIIGLALGMRRGDLATLFVSGALGATFAGAVGPWLGRLEASRELLANLKESTFLTAKTTAMVCWLFVGSALFSGVFALHGGQSLIERWVLGMNLSPLGFLILSQLIIFLLGWPLEWTEIIVIFVPIFIPLLSHFQVDPLLFGTMVAVNLQAAFLSPPVAMSAFYLKGVSPPHVTLAQIFAGMMPYMLIVILCLAFMYIWPGMTLWLPQFLYGG